MIDLVTRSVLLSCSPSRAFELFTQRISDWWPPERRHLAVPGSQIFLLPSGRFFERGPAGEALELGAVIIWEPAQRLVLDWYPGTDREHPTSVEVTFVAEGASTRVTVQHRAGPASDALFPSRAARYDASWALVLAALADVGLDDA